MIHLALPRDLVLLIFAAWTWLSFWVSADPYREAGRQLMRQWLGLPQPKLARLNRYRNGWTFAVGTALAVVLSWLCMFVSPYWWLT